MVLSQKRSHLNEPEAILYIVVPKTVELKYAFSIPHYKT